MQYVYVQNNEILDGPRSLPISWENISNFHVLDNERLLAYGWYPYRFVEIETDTNDILDGSITEIYETEVVETQTKRQKTQQELAIELENSWKNVRNERNRLLLESDWTQLPDSPITPEKKSEWQTYRQELRDITNQLDPKNISWPTKPV